MPKIDKSVPIPLTPKGSASYPFRELEVGESFVFPIQERNNLQSYASTLKKRSGKVYTISKINDKEARVWRVQ